MQLYRDAFTGSNLLNRVIFKDPKAMFEDDYEVLCEAPYSLLGSMAGLAELTQRIKAP